MNNSEQSDLIRLCSFLKKDKTQKVVMMQKERFKAKK